jgi:hypothetical protein
MVFFICIFLTISDVEHIFMYLLAVCIYSLEKISLPIFKSGFIVFVLGVPYIFYILAHYQTYITCLYPVSFGMLYLFWFVSKYFLIFLLIIIL